MSLNLRISENESAALGLSIARLDYFPDEIPTLRTALKELGVDVLKLTLANPPQDLYIKLNELGYRYYVLGTTLTYRCDLHGLQPKPYFHKDLEFVEHHGQWSDEAYHLARDVFSVMPASWYHNPGLEGRVSSTAQLECLARYVAGLNSAQDPEIYSFLLRSRNRFIGLVCGRKYGKGGEVAYAGIIRELQSKGYFLDIARFIQNHGISLGREFGLAHVQLQNTVMHKVLHHEGLYPTGHTLNIHVNCFE